MFCDRLPSSTKAFAQIASINSDFETTRPSSLTSIHSVSKTFGGSTIISSPRHKTRSTASKRKAPNSYNLVEDWDIPDLRTNRKLLEGHIEAFCSPLRLAFPPLGLARRILNFQGGRWQ